MSSPHRPSEPAAAPAAVQGRLRELFDQAMELPPGEREAWLVGHVGDAPLRADLLRLVRAAAAASGALETPPLERAARIGREPDAPEPGGLIGQRVGAFRLTEVIGQGGMSTVFRAEREGADFRHRVAIKLLRRGLYSDVEQRLFRRERQALAALSHPNIAHLIDGGVTEAGIPYLAIEYVDGVPITQYVVEKRLDLRSRLHLFNVVCRAVGAAHRQLIVHRDIKPSNILVTPDGTVKLLDFGIAKLLDESDEFATRTGLAALTPGYAAPEQYTGGTISTATDVYALGVVLHELLLGERPLSIDPLPRPSSRVTELAKEPWLLPAPRTLLKAALKGDLDNILLKALAAEPERRYASAAELADDVQRHLDARPVNAHPPSRWYRTRKFVQRHRGGVVATTALLAALLASLAMTVWQARQARQEAARATEVQGFLESLFEPLSEGMESERLPTLLELLERGRRRIEERYPNDRAVRAELLTLFFRIHSQLGETRAIEDLAAAARDAALSAWGPYDPRTLRARHLFAMRLRLVGDYDQARRELESLMADMRERGIRGEAYADALDQYAGVRMRQDLAPQDAVVLLQEALRVRESDSQASAESLAIGYHNLGVALANAGQFDASLEHYQRALALELEHFGRGKRTANVLTNIGHSLSQQGRWTEAESSLREARAMFADSPVARSPNMVSLLTRLCGVQADLELLEASSDTCDAAVAMAREVGGAAHQTYAMALARRAQSAFAAGRIQAMRADIEQARAVVDATTGNRAYLHSIIDGIESRAWPSQGDYARRRDVLAAALDPSTAAGRLGDRTPGAASMAAHLALACRHAPDETACGGDPVQRADALLDRLAHPRSVQHLSAQIPLAEIDLMDERFSRVLERLEPALRAIEPELPPHHSMLARARDLLAAARRGLGDDPGTARDAERAESIRERVAGD